MSKLFEPLTVLLENYSDELVEMYRDNCEEALEKCILTGCDHGAVHCRRELDLINENPLRYHIDTNYYYTSLLSEHFNSQFSIN